MRIVVLSLTLIAGLAVMAGCSTGSGNPTANAAAINAMDNPPNTCGPGGTADIEDCNFGR